MKLPGQRGRLIKRKIMATIDVLDLAGKKVGTLELAEEVFGGINEDLLWEAVKHYRSAQRAGTHATKNRKLVSGAGKKLWRQKGTGRARVGSIRSPLWRHGGTVHGPQPRSYDYHSRKKKLLGALRSALAAKLADGKLVVVENFELKEAKTKDVPQDARQAECRARRAAGRSWQQEKEPGPELAQLAGVEMVAGNQVHPYHLLRYERRFSPARAGEAAGFAEGLGAEA